MLPTLMKNPPRLIADLRKRHAHAARLMAKPRP